MIRLVAGVLFVTAACAAAPRPSILASTSEVEAQLRAFLGYFENLEWESFIAAFDDDACVFHPTPRTPDAFCGHDAMRATWQEVFDGIRQGATSGPPYHHLVPDHLQITPLGADAALATFELHQR